MKVINLDVMIDEHAKILIKDKEFILVEPTLRQWGEFQKIDTKHCLEENPAALFSYLIKIICPGLLEVRESKGKEKIIWLDTLNQSEYNIIVKACVEVMSGGIEELGKKTKPLSEIITDTLEMQGLKLKL